MDARSVGEAEDVEAGTLGEVNEAVEDEAEVKVVEAESAGAKSEFVSVLNNCQRASMSKFETSGWLLLLLLVVVEVVVEVVALADWAVLTVDCPKASLSSVTWLLLAAAATAAAEGPLLEVTEALLELLPCPLTPALLTSETGRMLPSMLTITICSSLLPWSSVATTDRMYCPACTPCTATRRLPWRARPRGS